jgi:tRNA(Ile)-lysidine synthase
VDRPYGHASARRRLNQGNRLNQRDRSNQGNRANHGKRVIRDERLHALIARCTFPAPGLPLTCAVSGGADSLALLVLATAAGCDVTAVHVDHGLRLGSADEAERVELAAKQFGAAFESLRVEVGAGPNIEARAREERRSALPPGASTGHTMDDQAETVLIRLLRGTGPDGLAAMRPGPEHPILALRRAETLEVTTGAGLDPFDDPTNGDPSILRNRVRHELLPLCSELVGRDVTPLLARLAALAAEDSDFLSAQADELDPTDAAAVRDAPLPLSRRALRSWLRGDGPYPPDLAAIERVLAVARGDSIGTEVVPGTRVRRTAGRLRLESPEGNPVERKIEAAS